MESDFPTEAWKTIRLIGLAYSVLVGLFFEVCFPEFCPTVPIHPKRTDTVKSFS